MRVRIGSVVALAVSLVLSVSNGSAGTVSQSQSAEDLRAQTLTAMKLAADHGEILNPLQIHPLDACTPKSLTPPSTIQGNMSALSCYDNVINSYEDIYNLNGVAGQTVKIDYSSSAYEVFLYMEAVPTTTVSTLSSGVSHKAITYTFPTTRAYKLEVETLWGPGDSQPHAGAYTLAVTLPNGGSSSCTDSSTVVCLNNRFAVSATWQSNDGSGSGQAVRLTSDTGYFTFFSASNVEVVVKVLNGCGLNSKYWVFAGGLTNVNVVLTVRDTQTGTVWTRTNPLNTAFQPIQDTGALATCP